MAKRKTQSAPYGLVGMAVRAMKKRRTQRTARPAPRRALRPKARTRKHKARRGVTKIGSYAGQLIASNRVTVPKAGARIRQRQFGKNEQANRHWTTGSNMGSERYYVSLLAEAVTTHILRECKDFRSTKTDSSSDVVGQIKLQFSQSDNTKGSGLPRELTIDLNNTSFDMIVYNALADVPGTGPNVYTSHSGIATGSAATLPAQIWLHATEGYYPSAVYVYRDFAADDDVEIYRDTQFAKAKVSMKIISDFKFQNVTPGSGTSGNNINAIDANPLQGKIATFRNQSPTFNKGFLAHIGGGNANSLTNFSGRPTDVSFPPGVDSWDKIQASRFTLPVIEQTEAMPARMTTVFANAKTSTAVHFPPGGFKSYKTGFTYSGSIWKFMRDATQIITGSNGVGKYPSMGSSFALCLVPTMKSLADEPITVSFDFHHDGIAHIVKYRGATLPSTSMFM